MLDDGTTSSREGLELSIGPVVFGTMLAPAEPQNQRHVFKPAATTTKNASIQLKTSSNPAATSFAPGSSKSMAQVVAEPPEPELEPPNPANDALIAYMIRQGEVWAEEERNAKSKIPDRSKVPDRKRIQDAVVGEVVEPAKSKPTPLGDAPGRSGVNMPKLPPKPTPRDDTPRASGVEMPKLPPKPVSPSEKKKLMDVKVREAVDKARTPKTLSELEIKAIEAARKDLADAGEQKPLNEMLSDTLGKMPEGKWGDGDDLENDKPDSELWWPRMDIEGDSVQSRQDSEVEEDQGTTDESQETPAAVDPTAPPAPEQASEVEISDPGQKQGSVDVDPAASSASKQASDKVKVSDTETKQEQPPTVPLVSAIADSTASPASEQASDEAKVSETETKQEQPSNEPEVSAAVDSGTPPASGTVYKGKKEFKEEDMFKPNSKKNKKKRGKPGPAK